MGVAVETALGFLNREVVSNAGIQGGDCLEIALKRDGIGAGVWLVS